jgi:hypothetical protein
MDSERDLARIAEQEQRLRFERFLLSNLSASRNSRISLPVSRPIARASTPMLVRLGTHTRPISKAPKSMHDSCSGTPIPRRWYSSSTRRPRGSRLDTSFAHAR